MSLIDKPSTLRSGSLRERIKVTFLSSHLKLFDPDEKTLDIGCGWGFSLKINPDFYCVDADADCIRHLQFLGAKASFADVSAKLPFDDGFFDNAFTHDVLEHLEENEMLVLFREARRVLKCGGVFMNVVPNRKGYDAGLDPAVGHKRFITATEVCDAAGRTGFEFVKCWNAPLPRPLGDLFVHNKLVTICRAT